MAGTTWKPWAARAPFAGAVALCALGAALAAAPAPLTSAWRTAAVAIDGAADEWPTVETVDKNLFAAAVNDDQFLYLTVSATSPGMRALLATGLIVWLDPTGKKEQTFGIWMGGVEPPLLPGMTADAPRSSSTGRSGRTLTEFDLLGPNKNQRRLIDITPELGLELATGTDDTAILYELKVPLSSTADRRYAVNTKPGATIAVGLATPSSPRDRERRGRLVGSGGYIGGNPYGGGYNGGQFADFAEPDDRPKPISIWTTLKLAGK
jgi:hypothetical protein